MKNLFLCTILLLSLVSCQIDSLSDLISTSDDIENADNPTSTGESDSKASCTLTTACEVVVFEDTSNLSVDSIQSGDGFLITVKNKDEEIIYEKECLEGGSVSMACTSGSGGEDNDEGEDNLDGNGEEDDQSKKSCTLTTACEVVVFEDTSNLSVNSIQSGDGFLITVKNKDEEIIYEKECLEGGSVSMACTSGSSGEDNDEGEDNLDGNSEEDDQSKKSCTLTTDCEVVVFEGTSNLSVKSIQSGDGFLITVKNKDEEIIYEKECLEGSLASLTCSSST
jgi:hypothetical protein